MEEERGEREMERGRGEREWKNNTPTAVPGPATGVLIAVKSTNSLDAATHSSRSKF